MRGISKERLLNLRDHFDKDYSIVEAKVIQDLLNECQELQEPWMTLEEFLRSGFVGKCWLGNNISGAVTCAYYYSGVFCKDNSSCGPKYISAQSITHVMPIPKPEPPR